MSLKISVALLALAALIPLNVKQAHAMGKRPPASVSIQGNRVQLTDNAKLSDEDVLSEAKRECDLQLQHLQYIGQKNGYWVCETEGCDRVQIPGKVECAAEMIKIPPCAITGGGIICDGGAK